MIRSEVLAQVVLSRKPLRVQKIGRVILDPWHWPFKVGAHHPGFRFLAADGVHLFQTSR